MQCAERLGFRMLLKILTSTSPNQYVGRVQETNATLRFILNKESKHVRVKISEVYNMRNAEFDAQTHSVFVDLFHKDQQPHINDAVQPTKPSRPVLFDTKPL